MVVHEHKMSRSLNLIVVELSFLLVIGKDLGPRASFMKACKERDYDTIAIGLGLHPLDLQVSSQGNTEVALQERFDIEIQRMCSVHSIATTEEFIPLLNLYLVQRI